MLKSISKKIIISLTCLSAIATFNITTMTPTKAYYENNMPVVNAAGGILGGALGIVGSVAGSAVNLVGSVAGGALGIVGNTASGLLGSIGNGYGNAGYAPYYYQQSGNCCYNNNYNMYY